MTNRVRQPITEQQDELGPDRDEDGAPVSARDILAKYLGYALPEVAAINPTSALLLDQAISGLMEGPNGDPLVPSKYS